MSKYKREYKYILFVDFFYQYKTQPHKAIIINLYREYIVYPKGICVIINVYIIEIKLVLIWTRLVSVKLIINLRQSLRKEILKYNKPIKRKLKYTLDNTYFHTKEGSNGKNEERHKTY